MAALALTTSARALDPVQHTWYYKGWGVGGWVEECATLWGTKNGSGFLGSFTSIAWSQYSYGGTCNVNYNNIGANRIIAGVIGYSPDNLVRCSNVAWNAANNYAAIVQASNCGNANRARHNSTYVWPNPMQTLGSTIIYSS